MSYSANTNYGDNTILSTLGTLLTAFGSNVLSHTTADAINNTGVGAYVMYWLTSGRDNTAVGTNSQLNTTTGNDNTSLGAGSLLHCTTGSDNTSVGSSAMQQMISGHDNTSIGTEALYSGLTCNDNVAIGSSAAYSLLTGDNNVFLGTNCGKGASAVPLTEIHSSVCIGANSLTNESITGISTDITNVICLGYGAIPHLTNSGVLSESNQMVLGNSNLQNIYTSATINALSYITTSDARMKTDVELLSVNCTELIHTMEPKTFTWILSGKPDIGFLAQDMQMYNNDIPGIVEDKEEQLGIAYHRLIPVLVKSIQELEQRIADLESIIHK
jgi:hypothetical protein